MQPACLCSAGPKLLPLALSPLRAAARQPGAAERKAYASPLEGQSLRCLSSFSHRKSLHRRHGFFLRAFKSFSRSPALCGTSSAHPSGSQPVRPRRTHPSSSASTYCSGSHWPTCRAWGNGKAAEQSAADGARGRWPMLPRCGARQAGVLQQGRAAAKQNLHAERRGRRASAGALQWPMRLPGIGHVSCLAGRLLLLQLGKALGLPAPHAQAGVICRAPPTTIWCRCCPRCPCCPRFPAAGRLLILRTLLCGRPARRAAGGLLPWPLLCRCCCRPASGGAGGRLVPPIFYLCPSCLPATSRWLAALRSEEPPALLLQGCRPWVRRL